MIPKICLNPKFKIVPQNWDSSNKLKVILKIWIHFRSKKGSKISSINVEVHISMLRLHRAGIMCKCFFSVLENARPGGLNLYLIETPLKYHVFENIMENGAFFFWSKCSIFHNFFKRIQNLT